MTVFLRLRADERSALESAVTAAGDTRRFRRALALLWLDEGKDVRDVARLLRVSRQTVYNWARRFGTDRDTDPELRLADAPRCGRPRTARGIIEPVIDSLVDKDPRDFGYRHSVWTSDLLVRHLGDAYGIAVSRRSVGYALKRLGIRWKFPRYDLLRRSPSWRQAKGGCFGDWPAVAAR